MVFVGKFFYQLRRTVNFFIKKYQKSQFKKCGENVFIGNNCIFTSGTISIGEDVHIGANCCLQSAHGEIIIGDHVMFGPGVNIHGGNHDINVVGKYMKEVDDKAGGDDGKVVICDDVWVGACAIILKGVTIGEGSIIGAGSIVTKDIPPYSIYVGVPSSRLKPRWDEETIKRHKQLIMERGGSYVQ